MGSYENLALLPEETVVAKLEQQLHDLQKENERKSRVATAKARADRLREQIEKLGGKPVA